MRRSSARPLHASKQYAGVGESGAGSDDEKGPKTTIRKLLLTLMLCAPALASAKEVRIQNHVRAESDNLIRANLAGYGIGVGKIVPTIGDTILCCASQGRMLLSRTRPCATTVPQKETWKAVTCPMELLATRRCLR